ncbi:MAG: helix-turn-helix domain-containing protein [Nitrospirota bacterium]
METTINNKEILTEQELQKLLGVSRTTLWKLRKNGHLPYTKIGREYRYLKSEIIEWLKESRFKQTQPRLQF